MTPVRTYQGPRSKRLSLEFGSASSKQLAISSFWPTPQAALQEALKLSATASSSIQGEPPSPRDSAVVGTTAPAAPLHELAEEGRPRKRSRPSQPGPAAAAAAKRRRTKGNIAASKECLPSRCTGSPMKERNPGDDDAAVPAHLPDVVPEVCSPKQRRRPTVSLSANSSCKQSGPRRTVPQQLTLAQTFEKSGRRRTEKWLSETWPSQELVNRTMFSEVHRVIDPLTGEVRALKKINKKAVEIYLNRQGSHLSFRSEAETMVAVQHSGIVRLFEWFETDRWFCLVLEFVTGGTLFDYISDTRSGMPEDQAMRLFRSLCLSVQHLHKHDIVHRDLKPENVLLMGAEKVGAKADLTSIAVKLADFGISRKVLLDECCTTFVGTLYYIAPEVWEVQGASGCADPASQLPTEAVVAEKSGYGKAADLWSLGVILYMMLSGAPPFDSYLGQQELAKQIIAGKWEFDVAAWKTVSEVAKDVVRGLLTVNPAARMTADDLLRHRWFQE
mmetsp:Transcript_90326/g.292084  ORF Transcript_90326/g.292084 Transcript_90326/m.292084 type:complete len:501 (+) Transcript_90326:70-1572(+)